MCRSGAAVLAPCARFCRAPLRAGRAWSACHFRVVSVPAEASLGRYVCRSCSRRLQASRAAPRRPCDCAPAVPVRACAGWWWRCQRWGGHPRLRARTSRDSSPYGLFFTQSSQRWPRGSTRSPSPPCLPRVPTGWRSGLPSPSLGLVLPEATGFRPLGLALRLEEHILPRFLRRRLGGGALERPRRVCTGPPRTHGRPRGTPAAAPLPCGLWRHRRQA